MANQSEKSGLFLFGMVERRTRRQSEDGNKFVVTYQIKCDGATVWIKHWENHEPYAIGEFVELPVRISVYQGKPQLSVYVSREEEF